MRAQFERTRRLVRAVRMRTMDLPQRWHERVLIRSIVVFSLFACHGSEMGRHRTRERALERAGAYALLVAATVLAWCCRWSVDDADAFSARLETVSTQVFRDTARVDIPLVVLSVLWADARVTVVHTTCVNFHYLYLLSGRQVRFLVSAYWMKFRISFLWHRIIRTLADPIGRRDRAVWLGNSAEEMRAAEREDCRTVFVNHNCFVNERHFPLLQFRTQPRFDAVLNANAGKWKRHDLTRDIPTLAFITYSKDDGGKMIWPVASFVPAYRNENYLDEQERRKIYEDACCGLALSACEGANYATVEFLLSGMPMVSTPSIGGRDVWLTDINSTRCEATCESVAAAVSEWRRQHVEGTVDHAGIRDGCLQLMDEHRVRFVTVFQNLLDEEGVCASARVIFDQHRNEDTLMHSLSFQRNRSGSGHPYCNGKGWYPLASLPFGRTDTSARGERENNAQ